MIKSLYIKDYALFKEVNIKFTHGFNIISGETGAGKSIILDALSLLLGNRIQRFSSSNQKDKTVLEAVFLLENSFDSFFKENDLDFENETIVRREIQINGRSRIFINDTPVLLSCLSRFGKKIVEMFAQDQISLLKDEEYRFNLIDELSCSKLYLSKYRKYYEKSLILNKDLDIIKNQGSLSDAESEYLSYQLNEIDSLNICPEEYDEIIKKLSLSQNIDGISNAIKESAMLLNNEAGVLSYLDKIQKELAKYDDLSSAAERIRSTIIDLNDISYDLNIIQEKLDIDPDKIKEMHCRLDDINRLLQKHKLNFANELINLKEDFRAKIELSNSFEVLLNEKKQEILANQKKLEESVSDLNNNREKSIDSIIIDIIEVLHRLGMPDARFDIKFQKTDSFHLNGNTSILFNFTANKGISLQEVTKVASGGEFSRIMLALKYISAKDNQANILVFDEIDSGVSGKVASLMGDMMKKISAQTQLIVISHLPQIAAKANVHFKVVKNNVNEESVSSVLKLDKESRLKEIAKLLSGKKITKAAIDNASELLSQ